MQETLEINRSLIEQFTKNRDQITASSPEFLQNLRLEAIDRFKILGLPGKRNELYKYTPLDSVFLSDYTMQFAPSHLNLNVEEMFTCDVPNLHTHLEVILNGFYFTKEKPLTVMDNGIIIGSLAEAFRTYPGTDRAEYGICPGWTVRVYPEKYCARTTHPGGTPSDDRTRHNAALP